jgi:L-ascorbate metabolism protein UlaG (beta-lactamase superfamily)/predicted TIM-barrel fold metal-dependent hydrolase
VTPRLRRRLLVALAALLALPALAVAVFLVAVRHVPWTVPAAHRGPAALRTPRTDGLSVRYLGVSGYEVSDGTTTLLLDPTPTRPPPLALLAPLSPDEALGAKECPKADAILVNHTHHDHALDVPAIALRTGALVIGSQSTVNLALSRGVPAGRTRLVKPGDHFTVGTFTIDVRGTRHADIAGISHPMGGVVSPTAGPLRFFEYALDETLFYRLEANGTSLWFHPTSTFAPGELNAPPAATLIVGVTGEAQTKAKVDGLLAEAKPRRVLPTHYDNFFQPWAKGLAKMPGLDIDAAKALFLADDASREWVVLDQGERIYLPPDKATADGAPRYRKVDAHVHVSPADVPRLVALMDAWGIDVAINLSGGWPGEGLEASVEAARSTNGRVVVFANPPVGAFARGELSIDELVAQTEAAQRLGAKGLKFFKSLGLGARAPDGTLLGVDDPRLDPLFEKAGELGLPISIHTGDPKAFWQPATEANERIDELSAHPGWRYAGADVPSWDALFAAYGRRVARHPRTTFIGVHFGNDPEDPWAVAAMLDALPNLYVDTAARVPELGRQPPEALRDLFVRYQDRILFGTDLGVGPTDAQLMLGSTGATPPTPADVSHFFTATWRFFETRDRDFAHPTPIQGRWRISGLGLPPEVLRKVYAENADHLLAGARRR